MIPKRKRRGRPRLAGDRTPSGRLSVAKPETIEPTPELLAKRAALSLKPGDETGCMIAALHRAGELTDLQRQSAHTLRNMHAALLAALEAPRAGQGTLAAFQPSSGGAMSPEAASLSIRQWNIARDRLGQDWASLSVLVVGNLKPVWLDAARDALDAFAERN